MVYKYEYRATRYKVSAQEAGEYIETLTAKEGGITPKKLLDASRNDDALLHDCFEWDDTEAAERYRVDQARHFISNLVCVVVSEDGNEKSAEPVRAFVNVMPEANAKGNFKHIVAALSDDDERQIVLDNAKRDLIQFKQKYEMLTELTYIILAIDEFIA